MEADSKWQRDLQRMLCAIGLDAAAVIEEVLEAGLQVDTKVGSDVVL